jgi:hypothetical protein
MRFWRLQNATLAFSLMAIAGVTVNTLAPVMRAQSNISGDITGTVTDPSGAALANAKVTVTSDKSGQVKTAATNSVGDYRVSLLQPGSYKISITAPGFDTTTQTAVVSAGTVITVSAKLTVGQASTTVEVAAGDVELLHPDDAQISTTFDQQQIQSMPNPGNDLTFVAQTAPGAVMNTQGGYGNFSVNGLPGTANTFTVNGGYEGDPYLNLNNSGATNLLLGNNDVESVTVTTNSYDAAFGGLGGAQVNEISRSGGNKYHGNLIYWWNGSLLNANSFFNKQSDSPKNFSNANQWAAAVGGPLKRDKIFGFIDTEGIRVVIPQSGTVAAPSIGYQNEILGPVDTDEESIARHRVLAHSHMLGRSGMARPHSLVDPTTYAPYGNLADNGNSSEAGLYQAIFGYYNNAKNYASGEPDPFGDPDVWIFNGQTTNFAEEWLVNDRVDINISDRDHLFIHSKADHGVQPTETSFLSSDFDALSPQPSYEGQLGETHTFTPALTNQFLFAASYYRAIFTNTNGAKLAQTIPFVLIPEGFASGGDWDAYGGNSNWVGAADYAFPQGRNVTGYQFSDDIGWTKGKHNLKFGFTMRRDDISDYTSSEHDINYAGGENFILDQGDFAAGYSDEWAERFPRRLSEPVALYVMGGYAQDQWKPNSHLTVTAGLRLEHNSNPLCKTNCVANFSQDFSSLPTADSTPYNQLITSGRQQAFFEQQNVAYEPRIGFSFLPGSDSKTTIRGGFGMFADYFPAQIMGDLLANMPNVDRFTVLGAYYGNGITVDSTQDDSGHAQAVTSNNALQTLFPQGGYYKNASGTCPDTSSIYCATGGVFTRPTFSSVGHKVYLPTYEEWSLAVEREIAKNTVLSVNYIGNHTYHQPVSRLPQAYDASGTNASLPASRPNASLGSVTEYYSGGVGSYNGLVATLTSRIHWLTTQVNYAYGHALDEISNGGFDAFGVNSVGQINPYNLRQNYGNADYDTRHYVSANYSINIPHFGGPRVLVDNWEVAGTVFHNSGYPFSVTDNSGAVTYGNAPLAMQLDNNFNHHCGGESHTLYQNGSGAPTGCDFASHFTSSTDYGQQRRNQLYGPAYTDFDFDIAKGFKIPHSETAKVKIGAQFFNMFNHPNFQIPDFDVNDSTLGVIESMANTPTSILGAFLGGDASPRLIQAKLSFTF